MPKVTITIEDVGDTVRVVADLDTEHHQDTPAQQMAWQTLSLMRAGNQEIGG